MNIITYCIFYALPGFTELQSHIQYLYGGLTGCEKRVVIGRTPLRISFAGGGTDIPDYYKNYGNGYVISAAAKKYVYIEANQYFFENSIRIHYSKVESDVTNINEVQHPVIKEALKLLGITKGIEISTVADVPSRGIGLGSSSSFTVGLLNVLHNWKGEAVSKEKLAEEAVHIERNVLKEAGGKQDQYVAAYGGLLFMEFLKDDSVKVRKVEISKSDLNELEKYILLLYTGKERSSAAIHVQQAGTVKDHIEAYKRMSELAYAQCEALENGKWRETGKLLHENWNLKKTLAPGISDPYIDRVYETAIRSGAEGGKIMGAGGGGFMMLFADPDKHQKIIDSIPEFKPEPFGFEPNGSEIIYTQGDPPKSI